MKKVNAYNGIIIVLSVVICVLLGVCFYFYKENKKLDDSMLIGTPINTNVTELSDVINDKEDFRIIQQALISAVSIEKPAIAKNLPDATIMISDYKQGICFLKADVWFDNDKVIFALGGRDIIDATYKEIDGDWGETVIECISKYKILPQE